MGSLIEWGNVRELAFVCCGSDLKYAGRVATAIDYDGGVQYSGRSRDGDEAWKRIVDASMSVSMFVVVFSILGVD